VPYKFAISPSHPAMHGYGRMCVCVCACTWIYSAKVGAEIGSRRNIFLDLSPDLPDRSPESLFRLCTARAQYVRTYVYVMPRAMDRRTGVLRQLFVSGGYAEHSKAPPEITGRFGAPASEIRTRNSHPSSEVENVLRRKRKRGKKFGGWEERIIARCEDAARIIARRRHTADRHY